MTTYQETALGVLLAWAVIGVVLGVVMTRRGYSGFGWGVLGAILGPFAVLLALLAYVPPRQDAVVGTGRPGQGSVDVLAGIDDSWECRHAVGAASSLLGSRVGRFTLAAVVPFDATPEEEKHARRTLDDVHGALRVLGALQGVDPDQVVLHGKPADALRHYATEHGYDAIAVGCHGHGASKAVLGSTADALTRHSEVPLIVSDGHGSHPERPTHRRRVASVS